jgi:hypothetical protein
MGPMLVLVLAIVSCVGFSIYNLGENNRFNLVSDVKGGVYVLDRKTSSINYCTAESCKLIGNGSLPSHASGNPAVLAAMQNSIMGAPAVVAAKPAGQLPAGMQANIATSGAAKPAANDPAAAAATDANELSLDEEETTGTEAAPEGFNFG